MGQNIGVFDSGLGGLSIYREIKKLLPNRKIIYFADHKNAPYGTKNQKEIGKLTVKAIKFLVLKKCNIIVIACNTATTGGMDFYRRVFPDVSFVGVVPPIKPAAIASKSKKIVILSTTATAKSKYLKDLIKDFASGCKIWNFDCPELVEIVESGLTNGEKTQSTLEKYLNDPLKNGADVIVLGCTHFPFLRDLIKKVSGEKIKILDPSVPVSKHLLSFTKKDPLKRVEFGTRLDEFYTSGNTGEVSVVASKLLRRKIKFRTAC